MLERLFAELDAYAVARGPAAAVHRYGPLRDHYATSRGDGPTVVVVHGGFWRARYTAEIMDAACVALAELGFAAWSIEYRRVGDGGGYPQTLEDVAAACRAAPDPVLAIGHSAGGQLALWAAAEGLVPAAVSLAGVCDLAGAARTRLGNGAALELMGGSPEELPDAYARADPLQRLPFSARLGLVHGVDDDIVPVGQSRTFAAAAEGSRLVEVPGAGHFDVIDPRSAAWRQVVEVVSDFAG